MKQTLQLKLGQTLTMTPQLQQAIRLLQLSSLELQSEIQEILETNPMLEVAEDSIQEETNKNSEKTLDNHNLEQQTSSDQTESAATLDSATDGSEQSVDSQSTEIPNDLALDTSWEDTFDNYTPIKQADPDSHSYEQASTSGENLQEHLLWQLEMSPFSEADHAIAATIIDAIDPNGYLTTSTEEIFSSIGDELEIELDEVESVLQRVQNFDPPGVGARNIQENLQLQLHFSDPDIPWMKEAKQVTREYFDLLANREFNLLMRRMKLSETELQQVIELLQSLNPRPGSQISDSQPEYIIPDVFIKKVKGKWKVDLNNDVTPKLSINSLYARLSQGNNSSSDGAYMKNNLQEARWFIKSLKSRNETLLKVARCIVERQRAFLEYGDEAMKPLVMHDVAEVVNMHESTISRVTTKKYMHTPRGIYELKYFFSSHVSTTSGGECSATAIRAMLRKLIAAEKTTKPLSDNKLASLLGQQGINVARRTVAKYREAMCIPPSNERKRLV